ncbi:MAG TPA: hypothetical protein VE891_13655 [Allosphingosinicella sp.]|nr:hypothetical protein [Allosphingosinicella sp.]
MMLALRKGAVGASFRGGTIGTTAFAGLALLGACATPVTGVGDDVALRYYAPAEAIVPVKRAGRLSAIGQCIFFHSDQRRPGVAALFPQRSRLSDDRRSILLPNGQSVPFDEKVTLISVSSPTNETWPGKPQEDETCGPNPVLVLYLEE